MSKQVIDVTHVVNATDDGDIVFVSTYNILLRFTPEAYEAMTRYVNADRFAFTIQSRTFQRIAYWVLDKLGKA